MCVFTFSLQNQITHVWICGEPPSKQWFGFDHKIKRIVPEFPQSLLRGACNKCSSGNVNLFCDDLVPSCYTNDCILKSNRFFSQSLH